ncbi:MAG: hypothetical protein H7A01_14300 [Hahellaceae bacterium]|nr:hypothetical protein [Hahellaceae bacterium]MCP5210228.1 hypothetical protein [Hahellaceae bacterium]
MKNIFINNCIAMALFTFMSASSAIAETGLVHKEKSTIDSFPLQALEQDDLSAAVISGGLEPTSAGESTVTYTPGLEDQLDLEVRDKQTDLGRSEVPITFNFREPRVVPGVTFTQSNEILGGNRTYHSYDTTISTR